MPAPTVELSPELVRAVAIHEGVCARPVVSQVTDLESGEATLVAIACNTTRESRCPPCALRNKRLRMQQCREGWHLDHEPEPAEVEEDQAVSDHEGEDQADADGEAQGEAEPGGDEGAGRRVRSTRRREDVSGLPRRQAEARTVGRVFEGRDGRRYRPSMFLTLTLPSYGRVDHEGVPVDPETYDYRRAALDAIHFSKLVDRWWQNLRRCAGYQVQYFATVEAQRRLAPHLHAAIRGVIPRDVIRQVVAATYHQVWWPAHDTPVYVDRPPVWSDELGGYHDPDTGALLPTWDQALNELDRADGEPAHVVRLGEQFGAEGLIAGTAQTDRRVGYLCKYLTEAISNSFTGDIDPSPAREAHIDRLAEEVRWLPCSPGCANWLRFGIQPQDARPGLVPGLCKGKAHDRENLGLGGRRVLVSRRWTGKTLTDHRADRAAVVRAALEEAGIDPDDHDRFRVTGTDGRWAWECLGRSVLDAATYAQLVDGAIATRRRWRTEYETAKERAGPGAVRESVA